jgi:hypothetical protein
MSRYYTVNITVEDESGEQFAVWRTDEPSDNVEATIADALNLALTAEEIGLVFDRMDE